MKLHLFHDWSKWGTPFNSALSDAKKCQARKCSVCGKFSIGYVKSPWNWWFNAQQAIDSVKDSK